MAVDQEGGSGAEAGRHERGLPGIELDEDEALPGGTVAFGFSRKLVKESFPELQDFFHMHADDEGPGGSGGRVGEDDVLEFVLAGRQDGGPLVDFGGIDEVEDG